VPLPVVAVAALGYVIVCLIAEAVWRLLNNSNLWLFGGLMLFDGIFLGVTNWMTGGAVGPTRYLILVHLAAVTLLASYRTGVKLALWDSLIQLCLFYGQRAGLLRFISSTATQVQWFGLVAFVIAMWVLTIAISSLTAVNERELRRRRFELEQLASMGHALEDAHDALSVGEKLLDALADTFNFTRMAIFAVSDEGPRLLTSTGLIDALVADFRLQPESVLAVARHERRSLLVREFDPEVDPWLAAVMPKASNVMLVPMVADGVVGVLVAETGEAPGSRLERRVVSTTERFAGHAALAMRNANLLERVKQMAATDGLTGLANRRSFDEVLERELLRAGRTDGRLSIVLIDVDKFKVLNDTYGHVIGDAVLRGIAAALRSQGREYDTIARFGGEEFAAILPGCSSGLALQVAERLREAVQDSPNEVPVTASCGVATYPYDGLDATSLVQAADDALYASKHAGRNTVRSAEQARAIAHPVAG
jgi:diguanylate cyclase (GGDEF)-like protein